MGPSTIVTHPGQILMDQGTIEPGAIPDHGDRKQLWLTVSPEALPRLRGQLRGSWSLQR